MSQLLRVLTFSPRLTVAVGVMLFGGIGGIASRGDDEPKRSSNAWSKDSTGGSYNAQKRADDGWGGNTKSSNPRDNRSNGTTTQEVWVDGDGVIHEKEDMKAIDPTAFE